MKLSRYKKRLDKDQFEWYTNRRVVRKEEAMEFTPTPDVDREIRAIAETVMKVFTERFPQVRPPVIAGGAIRDAILCKSPKDFDIFVDLSTYETPEEAEDGLCLMAGLLAEAFGRGCVEHSTAAEGRYGIMEDVEESGLDCFGVYNIIWQPPSDPNPVIDIARVAASQGRLAVPYQLIGRRSAPELSNNPLKWVTEKFDYSAVKALFDPTTMKYAFSEEFKQAFKDKWVTVDNAASYSRAKRSLPEGWKVAVKDLAIKQFEVTFPKHRGFVEVYLA